MGRTLPLASRRTKGQPDLSNSVRNPRHRGSTSTLLALRSRYFQCSHRGALECALEAARRYEGRRDARSPKGARRFDPASVRVSWRVSPVRGSGHRPFLLPVPLVSLTVGSRHDGDTHTALSRDRRPWPWRRSRCVRRFDGKCRRRRDFRERRGDFRNDGGTSATDARTASNDAGTSANDAGSMGDGALADAVSESLVIPDAGGAEDTSDAANDAGNAEDADADARYAVPIR